MTTSWATGDRSARAERVRDGIAIAGAPSGSLERAALFAPLAQDELEELAKASSRSRTERQQILFSEGEAVDRLYVVELGSFKRARQSRAGKELIVGLLGPGQCFGGLGETTESGVSVQALETSTAIGIPLAAVRRVAAANPSFALRLVRLAETWHREAEAAAARMAFESVPERLAAFLLESFRPESGELRYPVNQSEIASLIGSSRETVCALVNRFRRSGMLEIQRGRIRVVAPDRLAEL